MKNAKHPTSLCMFALGVAFVRWGRPEGIEFVSKVAPFFVRHGFIARRRLAIVRLN